MKMTPSILLNIVLVTILALSFFSIHTAANTSSYETTDAGPEYNPWRDLNDDGIINIYDVVMVTGIYGSTGTPINKTELLLELLDRVDSNEGRLNQVKTIRFFEPEETVMEVPAQAGYTEWKNVSRLFDWSPMNSSNNVILSLYYWFEYRTNITGQAPEHLFSVGLNLACGDTHEFIDRHIAFARFSTNYTQSGMFAGLAVNIEINCAYHKFWFQIRGYSYAGTGGQSFSVNIKNLNMFMSVADGLPANP